MAVAKVSIAPNGPASFMGRGRRLKKGETITITDNADIRYFQRTYGFNVKIVEGSMPKTPNSVPPPVPEEEDVEVEEEEVEVEEEEVEVEDEVVSPIPKRSELEKMTKGQLAAFASESLELELGMELTKAKMIDAIVESGEEDDE